jgi:hypothetical protein
MIKYWSSFSTPNQMDSQPVRRCNVLVGVNEVIVSEMSMAQHLISARIVIAFSIITSFGDMVNRCNKDLLQIEDPSIELADRPEELEVRITTLTEALAGDGFGSKELYSK